jgi:hypothetical protein
MFVISYNLFRPVMLLLPSNYKEDLNLSVVTSNRLPGDDLNTKPVIHTGFPLPKSKPEVNTIWSQAGFGIAHT